MILINQFLNLYLSPVRSILIILMLLVIMVPNLTKVWVVVDFKIHQEDISKTLCVKKNDVHNTCKGACHLKKQLDKVDDEHDHEKTPSNSIKKLKEVELFSEKSLVYSFEISQSAESTKNHVYAFQVSEKHIFSVFQPPRV